MSIDLSQLEKLEQASREAWDAVNNGRASGESINAITNKEQTYIRAVRADQAIGEWWVINSFAAKDCIRRCNIEPREPHIP